jgi:hypothetical protein
MAKHVEKKWTEEELDFVRKNMDSMSDKAIGEKLGRTGGSVAKKRHFEGIQRKVKFTNVDDDVAEIHLDEYPDHLQAMILRKVSNPL